MEVSPDSAGRHIPLLPEQLTEDQRELYESIAHGPRARESIVPILDEDGRLLGPFSLMTLAPRLGDAVQAMGAALRFHGRFAPVSRELAILLIAAHHDCDFEWFAHEPAALAAGLTSQQVDAVREKRKPERLDPTTSAVWDALHVLLSHGAFDATAYEQAIRDLGEESLAELVWLTGYYSMLALALAAFDPVLPAGARGVLTRHDPDCFPRRR